MSGRISVLVKFPPELLERVEAVAGKRARMATILDLIERGLGGSAGPALAPTPPPFPLRRSSTVLADPRRSVRGVHPITNEPIYGGLTLKPKAAAPS